jgi:hypothetical protein
MSALPATPPPPAPCIGPAGMAPAVDMWDINVEGSSDSDDGAELSTSAPHAPESEQLASAPEGVQTDRTDSVHIERDRSRSRNRSPSPDRRSTPSPSPRRADSVQLLLGSPCSRTPKLPVMPQGVEWWAAPLWHAAEHQRRKLPIKPWRPCRVEAFGAGTMSEAWGYKVGPCNCSTRPMSLFTLRFDFCG